MMKLVIALTFLLAAGCASKAPSQLATESAAQSLSEQISFFQINAQQPAGSISVKDFGAVGDGITNDTDAFALAANFINTQGGGTLWIPPGVYKVGRQTFTAGSGYSSAQVVKIENCDSPVRIIGNGAKLVAESGMKYGTFDPQTGQAYEPALPFTDHKHAAHATVMFEFLGNKNVEITDLELDGNSQELIFGGQWGDTGRQLRSSGLLAMNNDRLTIKRVHTHHHALDGVIVGYRSLTEESAPTPTELDHVVSEYNGRQGFSWVGGISLRVRSSKFNYNGLGAYASAPKAGMDIEAEDSINRDAVIEDSEFAHNGGVGLVADSGDSAEIVVRRSILIGSQTWALWPNKPYMRFEDCEIHGPVARAYGSLTNPASATHFIRTNIDDVGGAPIDYPFVVDLGGGGAENVVFDSCVITNKEKRGMYISAAQDAPVIVRNSKLVHANASMPSGDFNSYFYGVRFENTAFTEDLPANITGRNYYSSIASAEIGPSCSVSGNNIRVLGVTSGPLPVGTVDP